MIIPLVRRDRENNVTTVGLMQILYQSIKLKTVGHTRHYTCLKNCHFPINSACIKMHDIKQISVHQVTNPEKY